MITTTVWIILAGALATYLTRIGGHLILSRFERLHPRVDAGLRAVPQAVLATLVVPPALTHGWPEFAALCITGITGLRFGMLPSFAAGAIALVVFRAIAI